MTRHPAQDNSAKARSASGQPARPGPWVIDTMELGRRPGLSREYRRTVPAPGGIGLADVISIPADGEVDLDVLLEAVVEGVLVSATAVAPVVGECARCLDPISDTVEVEVSELFAYPESTTDETTDEDEVCRLVDEKVDMEPLVRDAIVLALPSAPLCSPDCQGMCAECGLKWADLPADHGHERIDPRWAALRDRFVEGDQE